MTVCLASVAIDVLGRGAQQEPDSYAERGDADDDGDGGDVDVRLFVFVVGGGC